MKRGLSYLLVFIFLNTLGFAQTILQNNSSLKLSETNEKMGMVKSTNDDMTVLTYFTTSTLGYMGFVDLDGNLAGIGDYNCFAYFPGSVISQHSGKSISQIDINISTQQTTINALKICVWTDTTNAGVNPAYEQVVDNFVNGWNEITLNEPYILSSEPVFIGYTITASGYCIGIEEGMQTAEPNGYGDMIQHSNGYVQHTGQLYLPYGDIAIKAYVGSLESVDAKLLSIDTKPYNVSGMVDITGTVKNLGSDPIQSYDVTYSINGEAAAVYSVTGVNITTGFSESFTHNVPADLSEIGEYNLSVDISNVNGGGETQMNNNHLSKTLYAVQEVVQKKSLYELFVAPTNIDSYAANEFLNDFLYNNNEDKATLIKYPMNFPEGGDPYYTEEAGARKDFYGDITGVPYLKTNGATFNFSDVSQEFIDEESAGSFFKINGEFMLSNTSATANVEVRSVYPVSGNLVLQMAVIEKTTTGNTGTNNQPEFHNIMMKFIDNPSGSALNNFETGDVQSISATTNLEGTHIEEFEDIRLVVWIQDNNTKEVYQSEYIELPSGVNLVEKDNFKIYPNPTNGKIQLQGAENSEVVVFNMLGEEVYRAFVSENNATIDLSAFNAGNYMIKIMQGKMLSTKKVMLMH